MLTWRKVEFHVFLDTRHVYKIQILRPKTERFPWILKILDLKPQDKGSQFLAERTSHCFYTRKIIMVEVVTTAVP